MTQATLNGQASVAGGDAILEHKPTGSSWKVRSGSPLTLAPTLAVGETVRWKDAAAGQKFEGTANISCTGNIACKLIQVVNTAPNGTGGTTTATLAEVQPGQTVAVPFSITQKAEGLRLLAA